MAIIFLCSNSLNYCFDYPGPTCCRHVQFLLKRRGLCPLLRNSEYSESTSQTCVCMSFCGNVHSCRGTGEHRLGQPFCLLCCHVFYCSSYPTHPRLFLPVVFVSVALRSSSWLPQKVSHCSGECLANHPGTARYNTCKHHACYAHTHPFNTKHCIKMTHKKGLCCT